MDILFKGLRVINPTDGIDKSLNLYLKEGIIHQLTDSEISVHENTEIIEAENLICSPGLFDMHVHFREPGQEYKETVETGCQAASNGGFTGVVCMPNTEPAIDDVPVIEYIKNRANGNIIDLYPSAAITKGLKGELLVDMLSLSEAGVLLFTDDGSAVKNTDVMRRAFDYAATRDLLIGQHCEDHALTDDFSMNESKLSFELGLKGYPTVAEDIIVARDIMLAEYCGNRRYHVMHISSAKSVDHVRQAKLKDCRVTCEVTPHHFSITEDVIRDYHPNHKMNPPLRTEEDIAAIINGIKDETIDCIASDHAPHALHEKDIEYELAPYGITGLETSLGVTLTHLHHNEHIDIDAIIRLMSVNPRKILGLDKLLIREGEIANLTIFNPKEEWTVDKNKMLSKSKNTPYHGTRLKGKPLYSINNKQVFKSVL